MAYSRAKILKNHLPNVPSEADIKKANELNLGETQMTHLEKIEELTLYTLQQHKQIKDLKAENNSLQDRLASLEKRVTNLASASESKSEKVAMIEK